MNFEKPLSKEEKLPIRTTDYMPAYSNVPDEFKKNSNEWVKWQQDWFFNGLKEYPIPKDGIDLDAAIRHLNYIQRSWDTKHEHKECVVAYLASKWFKSPN